MKQVSFELSSLLTIGDCEIEVAPERYRAVYEEFPNGQVAIAHIEINQARHGKPDNWQRCQMQENVKLEITRWLEDDIAAEQRRMVESFDQVRRFA